MDKPQEKIPPVPDVPQAVKDLNEQINPQSQFHEGHEKDIPDQKDFMDPQKFEKRREQVEQHLTGQCGEHEGSTLKGMLDKTKEAVNSGFEKLKEFIGS